MRVACQSQFRWFHGCYVAVTRLLQVTYQSLFRRFDKLASMSGTALTEAEELATIYNLPVLSVPPVLPVQRQDVESSVYKTVRGKSNAALNELMAMHRLKRSVLVGTTSVQASEAFSAKLDALGVAHQVRNAKRETARRLTRTRTRTQATATA